MNIFIYLINSVRLSHFGCHFYVAFLLLLDFATKAPSWRCLVRRLKRLQPLSKPDFIQQRMRNRRNTWKLPHSHIYCQLQHRSCHNSKKTQIKYHHRAKTLIHRSARNPNGCRTRRHGRQHVTRHWYHCRQISSVLTRVCSRTSWRTWEAAVGPDCSSVSTPMCISSTSGSTCTRCRPNPSSMASEPCCETDAGGPTGKRQCFAIGQSIKTRLLKFGCALVWQGCLYNSYLLIFSSSRDRWPRSDDEGIEDEH